MERVKHVNIWINHQGEEHVNDPQNVQTASRYNNNSNNNKIKGDVCMSDDPAIRAKCPRSVFSGTDTIILIVQTSPSCTACTDIICTKHHRRDSSEQTVSSSQRTGWASFSIDLGKHKENCARLKIWKRGSVCKVPERSRSSRGDGNPIMIKTRVRRSSGRRQQPDSSTAKLHPN